MCAACDVVAIMCVLHVMSLSWLSCVLHVMQLPWLSCVPHMMQLPWLSCVPHMMQLPWLSCVGSEFDRSALPAVLQHDTPSERGDSEMCMITSMVNLATLFVICSLI